MQTAVWLAGSKEGLSAAWRYQTGDHAVWLLSPFQLLIRSSPPNYVWFANVKQSRPRNRTTVREIYVIAASSPLPSLFFSPAYRPPAFGVPDSAGLVPVRLAFLQSVIAPGHLVIRSTWELRLRLHSYFSPSIQSSTHLASARYTSKLGHGIDPAGGNSGMNKGQCKRLSNSTPQYSDRRASQAFNKRSLAHPWWIGEAGYG
ncbi:hypothetical protein FN846DRAFT_943957 [Sphaerosporella brunnea]|uniref:Uncharacterized protein n=1 Tax=Sphaerosporella brunnea TaxID=1250544 RepID=A0A5J5EZM2_9PEZI|nr:hypothetical protein FN846DRAFT_943957 [Sphaerosporella brunnea]